MFILGHLGIGNLLAKPWRKGVSLKPLLIGTLLPDLIDKPLYYIPHLLTGKRGDELGLICGTRTFGHTAIFALALLALAVIRRSRTVAALVLGVATHLLLDEVGDRIGVRHDVSALLWPFTGWTFPAYPHANMIQHMTTLVRPYILFGEILGGLLLIGEYLRLRQRRKAIS